MEARMIRSLLVVFVVVGLLVGQHSVGGSSILDCYPTCFLPCVLSHEKSVLGCAAKCLKECIFKTNSASPSHYFCNFGCAYASCAHLSTRDDPREKEVESCVNSCSGKCAGNYLPSVEFNN